MAVKKHHLIFIFTVVMILVVAVIESPWLRNNRFLELTHSFKESSFEGVVTGVFRDKKDHNSMKIFYGQQEELDLTWFLNSNQLIQQIHRGDTISKCKNTDKIVVHSNGKVQVIKVDIIR